MPAPRPAAFILEGPSDFNVLGVFGADLGSALRTLGVEPIRVDLSDSKGANATVNQALADYGPALVAAFSFSGVGVGLGDDDAGGNIWEKMRIPIVSWMLDHPAYYLGRHAHPSPAFLRAYPTRDFLDFQRDYVKAPHRTAAIPFGAFGKGEAPTRRTFEKKARPLIVFPKSGGSTAVLEARWQRLPPLTQRILRDGFAHYWDTTARSGPVVAAALTVADAAGIELRNDLPLLCFIVAQLDQYVRFRKGEILVKELLKLPVTIYGQGFGHITTEGAKAEIAAPINYEKLRAVFGEALAVVSMNPNLDDNMHDRIYGAFGAGALPISDSNPWWRDAFPAMATFSYDFCKRPVTAPIEAVLADPEGAAAIAWSEGERLREARPMVKVAMDMLDMALLHRQFTFNFIDDWGVYVRHGS